MNAPAIGRQPPPASACNCVVGSVFLVDIANSFGTEILLSTFIPGSTGVACLNLAGAQTMALGFTVAGQVSNVLVLAPAARTYIAGLRLNHQAAAFDTVNGVALSGPCSGQTL